VFQLVLHAKKPVSQTGISNGDGGMGSQRTLIVREF